MHLYVRNFVSTKYALKRTSSHTRVAWLVRNLHFINSIRHSVKKYMIANFYQFTFCTVSWQCRKSLFAFDYQLKGGGTGRWLTQEHFRT
jgi:hypothetical protein